MKVCLPLLLAATLPAAGMAQIPKAEDYVNFTQPFQAGIRAAQESQRIQLERQRLQLMQEQQEALRLAEHRRNADQKVTPWNAAPKQALGRADRIRKYRIEAEAGDSLAREGLAWLLIAGNTEEEHKEAAKWFRILAEDGHAGGQFGLAVVYAQGKSVPTNAVEAVKWCRKAAEQGDADAQCSLGSMYTHGLGVSKDSNEAVKWYRAAANQGDAQAQFELARAYADGDGLRRDPSEAARWFQKAAEQGFAAAQFRLAALYFSGNGIPRDLVEAGRYMRKAADQGFQPAQKLLGMMYGCGSGVPKDLVESYHWLNLAAANGDEEAAKMRDNAEHSMTPDQVAQAQRLCRDYQAGLVREAGPTQPPHAPSQQSNTQPSSSALSASTQRIPESSPQRRSSVTSTTSRVGRVYTSSGRGHWVRSKTDDGEIVILEDGSTWQVDVLDRLDTSLWLPMTDVTVVEDSSGYLLINTDDGEKARATLLTQ